MTKNIILASTSPRRKDMLEKAGLRFEVVASNYEEDMTLDLSPSDLVKFLSSQKAEAVSDAHPHSIIIAADTVVVLGKQVLGKPHTPERAKEMLRALSATEHSIITGFTVLDTDSGKIISQSVETKVLFKSLTEWEIDEYVASGEPLDKAGAYAIQLGGAKFVERIEGDFSNAIGLPVDEVMAVLKEFSTEYAIIKEKI